MIIDATDAYDKSILRLLNEDGRMPYSQVAHLLGISNTMVHQRINKLLETGTLEGFRPILNEKKLGFDWVSFTGLTLDKDHSSERIIEALKAIPEVTECYYITGAYTLFIRISAHNHEHMRRVLYEQIDNIPGVIKTDSFMELGCAFKRNVGI